MKAGLRLATQSSSSSSVSQLPVGGAVGLRPQVLAGLDSRRRTPARDGNVASNAASPPPWPLTGASVMHVGVVDGAVLDLVDEGHRGKVPGGDRSVGTGTARLADLPRGLS